MKGLDFYRHPEVGSERDGLVIGYAAPAMSAWSVVLETLIRLLP